MASLRPLSAADLDLICHHREEMFREAGRTEPELAAMALPFRRWLEPRLADGRYFGFIAEDEGAPVGGVGLMEMDWPPHPFHPGEDRRGYVLNVFVEPEFRRRGYALLLMEAAEREFFRRGVSYAILHATEAGAPLYKRIGWAPTSEMAKRFSDSAPR
jgi:GNAT superfamily N-acetyltransferase